MLCGRDPSRPSTHNWRTLLKLESLMRSIMSYPGAKERCFEIGSGRLVEHQLFEIFNEAPCGGSCRELKRAAVASWTPS